MVEPDEGPVTSLQDPDAAKAQQVNKHTLERGDMPVDEAQAMNQRTIDVSGD